MKTASELFQRLENLTIEPIKPFQRQEDYRQSRLVSIIQLVIIVLTIPAIILFRQESPSASEVFIASALINLLAYIIARRGRYRVGAAITILLQAITPLILVFFGGSFAAKEVASSIVATSLTLLIGSLFFPIRLLFVTAAFNMFIIYLMVQGRGLDFASYTTPILLTFVIAVLIIVAARHRDLLEKDRMAALSNANHELEIMQANLEERVADRTQDLQKALDTIQAEHETLLKSERMASLGRLTAGIAHEINTPLAASRAALVEVRNLTDEYLDSLGDPEVNLEDFREIGQETLQSIKLTEDGLERIAGFVRSIKAQMHDAVPRERILFNAVPVIRESLLLVNHSLRAAHCTADLETPSENVEIFGLPGQLSQVITNLVTNAIDASAGADACRIALRLETNDSGIELRVSDQGEGIPEDIQPRIFDLLFTTKPRGSGTGLGLTIVRDIVTNIFGGTIKVVSQVGQGTTFSIHFPYSGEDQNGT
jgi:signal transduction histidine kinase